MKWLVFGSLQATDIHMDLSFKSDYLTDFVKSREYNGLGTFSYGLHLAAQEVVEYRAIPFNKLPWIFRKASCQWLLELERYQPKLAEERVNHLTNDFLNWLNGRNFDAFFTRELFTFSPAQLEELTQHFSVRALWLSWSPGRALAANYAEYLKYFTHIYLIDPEGVDLLVKEGYNAYYLPLGLSDFCTNSKITRKAYPIGFIGTIYPNRMQLLSSFNGQLLNFWAPNFESDTAIMYPDLVHSHRGCVWGQSMLSAMGQVEVLINPVHRSYMMGKTDNVTNFRNFESLGEYTFQLSEFKPSIREIFDEDEVATYSEIDELNDKVNYFLKEPEQRRKMVLKARGKVLSEHLYSHRMKTIIDSINS